MNGEGWEGDGRWTGGDQVDEGGAGAGPVSVGRADGAGRRRPGPVEWPPAAGRPTISGPKPRRRIRPTDSPLARATARSRCAWVTRTPFDSGGCEVTDGTRRRKVRRSGPGC